MKNKERRRSSTHERMKKLFSFNKHYRSVERDDESRGDDNTSVGLLQEESSSPQTIVVLPPEYSTTTPSNELHNKEGDECPSTPDSFLDLIGGRKFDFASVPIEEEEEEDPFTTTETAPIVAGGSHINNKSDVPTRKAQKKKDKRQSSLCEWPEDDNFNEELVVEPWQGGTPKPVHEETPPAELSPAPEYIVSGTIELKTKDQPSGVTFQKKDPLSPLKIQGFSPFSQFKTKTDLKPGMVVLEINGRDMTWASAKDAVIEIKRAKPGTVTIVAIDPNEMSKAPAMDLVGKISTPTSSSADAKKVKKEEHVVKTNKEEPQGIKTTWPPKQEVKSNGDEVKKTIDQVETLGVTPSKPTHHRDPTLTMMDSVATEKTEDTTSEVKTPDAGPTFKELNPAVMTVASAVTVDDAGTPTPKEAVTPKEVIDNVPLESKTRTNSFKRSPGSLLGREDDDVEMEAVFISQDYSVEEEKEEEPEEETNNPQPSTTTFYTPKQKEMKETINLDDFNKPRPPLPPKRASSAPSTTRRRPPSILVEEPAEEVQEDDDSEDFDDEDSQEGIFSCNAIDVHIAPMLQTMTDFSNYATSISERMPSWMRVLCHE